MKHSNERPPLVGSDGRDWVLFAGVKSPTSTLPHSQNQPWWLKRQARPRPETPAACNRGARR